MPKKNNLPTYFEELKLDSEHIISPQDIISQLKQQIPTDYLEIVVEEGNYCGSTNSKWKDKPLSERYGFTHEREWIQIDIPHSIIEKLGLDKSKEDKDISQPFYLNPQVLTRKETYKGINIENEEEIILVNPNNLGVQTELSSEKNNELEKTKAELEREKEKNNSLNAKVNELENELTKINQEKQSLQNAVNNLNSQITNLQDQWKEAKKRYKIKVGGILRSGAWRYIRELVSKNDASKRQQVWSLEDIMNNTFPVFEER